MRAIAIGIGATLLMDAWHLLLRRGFSVRSLDYCLLGRWVLHMPEGTFRHANIAAAQARTGECALGWASHYSIGVALAIGYVLLTPAPTLANALAYGVATAVFPLFVLQPALGFGVAGSKLPHPLAARARSVLTHLVYGTGLYVMAVALS